MAVIKAVSSKASISTAINYVTKEEKTIDKYISGINCNAETALLEMQTTKELYGKTGGRTYKHFVMSYHADEKIEVKQAHENALDLAKQVNAFSGFEVLVATHQDRNHIHSHFIVNSVSAEDGHKLQWSKFDLSEMKRLCNEQSKKQNLHVPERGKTFAGEERESVVAWTKEKYDELLKADKGEIKSYIQDIAVKVLQARETAESKEQFVELLKEKNIGVIWEDTKKYITFIDLDRQEAGEKQCKVRNNKLEQYYNVPFGKDELENEFESNLQERELQNVAAERRNTKAEWRERSFEQRERRAERAEHTTSLKSREFEEPTPEPGELESFEREIDRLGEQVAEAERVADNIRPAERSRILEERSEERKRAGEEFSDKLGDCAIEVAGLRENQQWTLGEQKELNSKINGIIKEQGELIGEQQSNIRGQRSFKETIDERIEGLRGGLAEIRERIERIFKNNVSNLAERLKERIELIKITQKSTTEPQKDEKQSEGTEVPSKEQKPIIGQNTAQKPSVRDKLHTYQKQIKEDEKNKAPEPTPIRRKRPSR